MKSLILQHRIALLFILKFVGFYLVANTSYAAFVKAYLPWPDPVTLFVSEQVATILSSLHAPVEAIGLSKNASVALSNHGVAVVTVFEGCNGVNVMIVFVSFVVAFTMPGLRTFIFAALGIVTIYLINLVRVSALFEIAYFYPEKLYFFHKYLFTALLYAVVFLLWFIWLYKKER